MNHTAPITSVAADTEVTASTDEACSCGTTSADRTTDPASTPGHTSANAIATYIVAGMTCGHCVTAVKSELADLAGVTDVDVDLASGQVTVASAAPLATADVAAAIDEAGYELVVGENDAIPGR